MSIETGPKLPNIPTDMISPSDIFSYIGKSDILNNLLNFEEHGNKINIFKQSFLSNIDFIKILFLKNKHGEELTKEELDILNNFSNIDKQAKQATIELINHDFKDFLPKAFKVEEYINSLKENAFLCKECYEKARKSGKLGEKIAFDLYLIIVNYIISYYKYLSNISASLGKTIEPLDGDKWRKIQKFKSNLDTSNLSSFEDDIVFKLIVILYDKLSTNNGEHVFLSLSEHIKKLRFKTPVSAVKKLLKSPKYREQFYRLGILPDQIGVLFIYDDIGELKQIAEYFKKHSDEGEIVGKFNDRGVLDLNHENKDTIKGITPFVNTEMLAHYEGKELPLGELSLRMTSKNQIDDIFENNKGNAYRLLFELISKVDFLNHDIYKLSQDIKILRRFLIDDKTIKSRNLEKAIDDYLKENIEKIKKNIERNLPGLLNQYSVYIDEDLLLRLIELIVNEVLLEKLELVVNDIAWESVLPEIKETSVYDKLDKKKKRPYLRRLSAKFIKQIENPDSNPLGNYGDEIKNIFQKYKKNYNQTKRSALFYKKVLKNVNTISNKLEVTSKTNNDLYQNLIKK